MRIITLTQPWATLIAIGAKTIETRSWQTTYRGKIAIHAAKGFPPEAQACVYLHPYREALAQHAIHRFDELPLGQIVALADLVDVAPTQSKLCHTWLSGAPYYEQRFGDYGRGRFAWLLQHVVALTPSLEYRGSVGLMNVPPRVRAEIAKRLAGQAQLL